IRADDDFEGKESYIFNELERLRQIQKTSQNENTTVPLVYELSSISRSLKGSIPLSHKYQIAS
ncbi:MAG: hypothetical protein VKL39_16795, partial [Leptolyngbyaceae bacterium]|nr:hypothetical protein [Leptolyngbyaceae bacterium]